MAPKGEIGFYGGMALLISSITGPGLTTIPLLFQQSGWFSPTLAFLVFGFIAFSVSLFLVETMSTIQGNESFQAKAEYSTVAHLYMGKKAHIVMQILLYCALQSVNVSSIIISEQTMDSLLIRLFHKTCAVSFTDGWTCVSKIDPSGSPFDSYILFSLGYIISACMVVPLSMMSLVDNIKFQLASVAALFFVMVSWIYIFAAHGLDQSIPAFGSDQGSLMGFVLNNFAFITTVPSFINELSRRVSIHRVIHYPIIICVITYLIIGLLGAASFKIVGSSDILATLAASEQNKVLITIVNIVFPISVLVTSVPVFAIVIRYNLVRGNICSNRTAFWLASVVPWILIIPFQTKGWLLVVMNWTSLIFGSTTNFIIPLVLYISSKTVSASTIDTTGGDLFVLYRPSQDSTRRSAEIDDHSGIPTIVVAGSEDPNSAQEATSSPLLVVHTPSRAAYHTFGSDGTSLKAVSEMDITDPAAEASSSRLDPSDTLRVVYSPSVSRSGSLSSHHSEDRPSIIITGDSDPESNADHSTPKISRENSPTRLRASSTEIRPNSLTVSRRRSRSAASDPSTVFSDDTSVNNLERIPAINRPRALSFEERGTRERVTFKAFPDKKWWKSILVAKIALGITSGAVLGNLIYTIVDTARGNSPLSN